MIGIYLHIPFCRQACTYCDFFFTTRGGLKPAFLKSLTREISSYRDSEWSSVPVLSVYFGGGTPSRLTGDEFTSLLDALGAVFNLNQAVEITVEVNPDDLTPDYLRQLKQAGVNRLSVGIQTFSPERLRFMNRAHTREHALQCLRMIREEGFHSWTADLIYGNPGQTTDALAEDIETLLDFDPPHISAYALTIEPHTRLGSMVRKKLVEPADDELVAEHTDLLVNMLAGAGVERYEVSNFARPGHEAVHNSAYWSHQNYLGLGPGAHSFSWKPDEVHAKRWSNKPHLPEYMEKSPNPHEKEDLTIDQLATERLMMGLRTSEGLTVVELEQRYRYSFSSAQQVKILKFREEKLLNYDGASIRLTGMGMLVADRITLEIISC
ncbi:MAG: radical SAM family heme chaperone HemW [Cyclonatronaceae bacterium]